MGKLTTKQVKFIAVYAGNGVEAARLAGYAGNEDTLSQVAYENLRKPDIALAIKSREDKKIKSLILSREKRQIFWSQVTEREDVEIRDRLRASELLGRSESDFVEKVELDFKHGLADRLTSALKRKHK